MSEESDFPNEMGLVIVDDLYRNYELGYEDGEDTMFIYCNTCEEIVGNLSYEAVLDMEDTELYERIIEEHRPM